MWLTKKMTVKACRRCSNVDAERLKTCGRQEGFRVKVGCIGGCRQNHLELTGLSFGLVDDKLATYPDEDTFVGMLRQMREA